MNDTPNLWLEDEDDMEIQETQLVTVEEIPLPSIVEQEEIVKNSDVSDVTKGILGTLVEMTKVSNVLCQIQNDETKERQKTVLEAMCAAFLKTRMENNSHAESLKYALLNRLLKNIDNLDLETCARILVDLQAATAADANQAAATLLGAAQSSNGSGVNINVNTITGENTHFTANTLNNGDSQQITHLKETSTLNNSIKSLGNIPTKPKE